MKKVLIAFDSKTGNTGKMAENIADGFRSSGKEVVMKRVTEITSEKELEGYDAYIFGCPTYFEQPTDEMKQFLFIAEKANLEGKVGGSFGSYTHFGNAPRIVHDTMEFVFKMNMIYMGPFKVKELYLESREGCDSCVDYAKGVSQRMAD